MTNLTMHPDNVIFDNASERDFECFSRRINRSQRASISLFDLANANIGASYNLI
jgi:hypothetical protein